ncbi:MAG: ATP-binding protein [Acidimicrobiales bacterium]
MRRRDWLVLVAVGLGGVVTAAVVAALGGLPMHEAVRLVLYSTVGAAMAGAVAAVWLHALRHSNVGVQAAVAALAPVLAAAIGVAWATAHMFLMSHDLWVLWVVLCSASGIGLILSILFSRRVTGAVRSVGEMARRLGESEPASDREVGPQPRSTTETRPAAPGIDADLPAEVAELAAELRRSSARLAAAREQASALDASRRELVAWVSHDLRTPLAGIRAMVEALEDGIVDDPDTVARYHRTIRREADRLAGLVNDLFELSRIHAGSLSLSFEPVPLDELVSDAVSGAAVAASAKGIEVRSLVRDTGTVELSSAEMVRVVRNLLDNAIRHTPAGGVVVVDAEVDRASSSAVVSVLDACGGIPEADLDRVFEMAYRGDSARSPGDGGGGLGLAVARGLVEAHCGEILVRNEGPGCRFVVRLPCHRVRPG